MLPASFTVSRPASQLCFPPALLSVDQPPSLASSQLYCQSASLPALLPASRTVSWPTSQLCFLPAVLSVDQPCFQPAVLSVGQPPSFASSQLYCQSASLPAVSFSLNQPLSQPASLSYISRETWDCTYVALRMYVQCVPLHSAHIACVSWWKYYTVFIYWWVMWCYWPYCSVSVGPSIPERRPHHNCKGM